jgi:Holliday junction resolvasome RuvABC endonuclease subunit
MEVIRPVKILAIDPGTRHLGVAVLEGSDLIYATVKNVKDQPKTPKNKICKIEKIIARLIAIYRPDILAIEKTLTVQLKSSPLITPLTRAIIKQAKSKKLTVCEYVPNAVRKFICHDGKATRLKTATTITEKYYPWLKPYLEKDLKKRWWEGNSRYWEQMFGAIALALTCLSNVSNRAGKAA